MPWVLRLSMTSTTVSASGYAWVSRWRTCRAQSILVRWGWASTRRQPRSGSTQTKIEQVPWRTYTDLDTLNTELAAWQHATNTDQRQVQWHFTTADARIKL